MAGLRQRRAAQSRRRMFFPPNDVSGDIEKIPEISDEYNEEIEKAIECEIDFKEEQEM